LRSIAPNFTPEAATGRLLNKQNSLRTCINEQNAFPELRLSA
jgi:hypothetical protein